MFSNAKLVKMPDEKEVEIYFDNCSECNREMIAAKIDIDNIKQKSIILYNLIAKIDFCSVCLEKKIAADPNYKAWTDEEYELLKKQVFI